MLFEIEFTEDIEKFDDRRKAGMKEYCSSLKELKRVFGPKHIVEDIEYHSRWSPFVNKNEIDLDTLTVKSFPLYYLYGTPPYSPYIVAKVRVIRK